MVVALFVVGAGLGLLAQRWRTAAVLGLVAALVGCGPRWASAPQLAAWAAMVAGAFGGGLAEARFGEAALAVPAAWALAAAAIAAWAAAGHGGGATGPAAAVTQETLSSGSGPT